MGIPTLPTQLGIWNDAVYKIGATRLLQSDITSLSTSNNPIAQYLTDIWPMVIEELLEEHPWSFAVQTVPMVPLNPTAWVTATTYSVGTYVLENSLIYVCSVAHTSGTFATDLASGNWTLQTSPLPLTNPPSAWLTATAYVVGNYVIQSNNIYVCAISHTSGTFATDLAAGDWVLQTPIAPLLIPLALMNDGCNNPYFLPPDYVKPYRFSAYAFYREEVVNYPYLATGTLVLITNNSNMSAMKYVSNDLVISLWSSKFCNAISSRLASKLCFKISEAAQYAAGLAKQYDMDLITAIASDSNTTSPDEAIASQWFEARLTGSTGAVGLGQDNDNFGWWIPGADF